MVKDIKKSEILIAQVYDLNSMIGTLFPTPSDSNFQFGFSAVQEDKELTPHIHKKVHRKIDTTSEFLYVVLGEIQIDVFDDKEQFLEKVILKDNMGFLQFIGGHKISIRAKTKFFEIKQGPYYGRDFDKYEINV